MSYDKKDAQNFKYGGYGRYESEMLRLGQLPGLPKNFANRKLENIIEHPRTRRAISNGRQEGKDGLITTEACPPTPGQD